MTTNPSTPHTLESGAPQESVTGPHPTVASGTHDEWRIFVAMILAVAGIFWASLSSLYGGVRWWPFGTIVGLMHCMLAISLAQEDGVVRTRTNHQQQR